MSHLRLQHTVVADYTSTQVSFLESQTFYAVVYLFLLCQPWFYYGEEEELMMMCLQSLIKTPMNAININRGCGNDSIQMQI